MTPPRGSSGGVLLDPSQQVPIARMVTLAAGILDVQAGPAPATDSPAHALLLDVAAGTAYHLPLDLAGARRLHAGLGRLIDQLQAPQPETPASGGREDKQP